MLHSLGVVHYDEKYFPNPTKWVYTLTCLLHIHTITIYLYSSMGDMPDSAFLSASVLIAQTLHSWRCITSGYKRSVCNAMIKSLISGRLASVSHQDALKNFTIPAIWIVYYWSMGYTPSALYSIWSVLYFNLIYRNCMFESVGLILTALQSLQRLSVLSHLDSPGRESALDIACHWSKWELY